MCYKFTVLAFACISGLAAQSVHYRRHVPEDTGYRDPAAAVHAGSKFFQDIYVAMEKPNEIQFGHVSETPKEWEQRFEKIDLGNHQRQGKVRWGDKDGGYGEHYWDFNHDGQQAEPQPQPQPKYYPQASSATGYYPQESRQAPRYARPLESVQRGKREQGLLKDVEFINDKARALILDGKAQKHGGNYRAAFDYDRGKREEQKEEEEEDDYDY